MLDHRFHADFANRCASISRGARDENGGCDGTRQLLWERHSELGVPIGLRATEVPHASSMFDLSTT